MTIEDLEKLFIDMNDDERSYVIYNLLLKGIVSFTQISNLYVASLEKNKLDNQDILNGLGILSGMVATTNLKYKKDRDIIEQLKPNLAYYSLKTKALDGTIAYTKIQDLASKSNLKSN